MDAAGGAGLSNAETSTLALNVYDVLAPVAVLRNDPYNEQAEARAAETAALTDLRVCWMDGMGWGRKQSGKLHWSSFCSAGSGP